jgi:hypothetical protein
MARAHRAPAARGLPPSVNAYGIPPAGNSQSISKKYRLKTNNKQTQNSKQNNTKSSHMRWLVILAYMPSPAYMPSAGLSGSLRSPKMPSSWHIFGFRHIVASLYRFCAISIGMAGIYAVGRHVRLAALA